MGVGMGMGVGGVSVQASSFKRRQKSESEKKLVHCWGTLGTARWSRLGPNTAGIGSSILSAMDDGGVGLAARAWNMSPCFHVSVSLWSARAIRVKLNTLKMDGLIMTRWMNTVYLEVYLKKHLDSEDDSACASWRGGLKQNTPALHHITAVFSGLGRCSECEMVHIESLLFQQQLLIYTPLKGIATAAFSQSQRYTHIELFHIPVWQLQKNNTLMKPMWFKIPRATTQTWTHARLHHTHTGTHTH